jgi:hypothetical protein
MTPEDERKERMQDYLICFSTQAGKRVLSDLAKAYDRSCFDADLAVMAYKEGKRDVLLAIRYLMDQARRERAEGPKQQKAETE